MAGDKTAAGPRALRVASRTGDHPSLDDDRAGRLGDLLPIVGALGLPDDLAGPSVEGHEKGVVRGQKDLVVVDRDVPVAGSGTGDIPRVVRDVAAILPEQVAGRGVERLHGVAIAVDEHRAVADERHALVRAGGHGPAPDEPEVVDVAGIDLAQGAEAVGIVAAAPGQPVAGRRVDDRVVGDRREVVERARQIDIRLGRVGRERHEAEAAGRDPHLLEARVVRRQRRVAGHDAVLLQHEGDQTCVLLGRERPGADLRHRRLRDFVQLGDARAAIYLHERRALERITERPVVEIGAVAVGAACGIELRACFGLSRRVRERDFLSCSRPECQGQD